MGKGVGIIGKKGYDRPTRKEDGREHGEKKNAGRRPGERIRREMKKKEKQEGRK